MADLDPRTRAQLRALQSPSPQLRAQMLESIWSQVDGPGGPDDPGSSTEPGASDGGSTFAGPGAVEPVWIAKIVGATAGLTAAGLLIVRLGAVILADDPTPPAPTHESAAATPDDVPPSAPSNERAESRPALDEAPTAAAAASARSRPRSSAGPEAESAETPAKGGSLAAELALVREAEAVAARDPETALARLEQHRAEFPAGVLAPEREVLRVEVLCALARTDEASRVAASARERYTDAPLLDRIAASCAGD